MKYALLVVEDFLTYTKGDIIADPALVKKYATSEFEAHVVKTAAPAPTVTADAAAK